jgi:transcriptional regulator with XRE-family HTH domain
MFDLKRYIYMKRITRKGFARQCGVSVPTLRLIERGKPVSRKVALKVARVARCSIVSLIDPKE